jgi:hypothetical protein
MGQFDPMKAGSIIDQYLDIAADLAAGETITSVVFLVTDAAGATVANVVGAHTETTSRTDFRVTAPAAGAYTVKATFTINDGQVFPRYAGLWVV